MNCYECEIAGRTNAAIGICRSCGVGVCAGCLRWEPHDHSRHAGPGNPTPELTRSLVCNDCAMALISAADIRV
jgi:hypothetical protein